MKDRSCETLFQSKLLSEIHCMCDVTNGGLRGDLHEIAYEAKVGITIFEEKIKPLVNEKVFEMLKKRKVDYLGVSLDALLIFCPTAISSQIMKEIRNQGIKIEQIGVVNKQANEIKMIMDSGEVKLFPRFRESAYTPIKVAIGEEIEEGKKQQMADQIEKCANQSLAKRAKFVDWINSKTE